MRIIALAVYNRCTECTVCTCTDCNCSCYISACIVCPSISGRTSLCDGICVLSRLCVCDGSELITSCADLARSCDTGCSILRHWYSCLSCLYYFSSTHREVECPFRYCCPCFYIYLLLSIKCQLGLLIGIRERHCDSVCSYCCFCRGSWGLSPTSNLICGCVGLSFAGALCYGVIAKLDVLIDLDAFIHISIGKRLRVFPFGPAHCEADLLFICVCQLICVACERLCDRQAALVLRISERSCRCCICCISCIDRSARAVAGCCVTILIGFSFSHAVCSSVRKSLDSDALSTLQLNSRFSICECSTCCCSFCFIVSGCTRYRDLELEHFIWIRSVTAQCLAHFEIAGLLIIDKIDSIRDSYCSFGISTACYDSIITDLGSGLGGSIHLKDIVGSSYCESFKCSLSSSVVSDRDSLRIAYLCSSGCITEQCHCECLPFCTRICFSVQLCCLDDLDATLCVCICKFYSCTSNTNIHCCRGSGSLSAVTSYLVGCCISLSFSYIFFNSVLAKFDVLIGPNPIYHVGVVDRLSL